MPKVGCLNEALISLNVLLVDVDTFFFNYWVDMFVEKA